MKVSRIYNHLKVILADKDRKSLLKICKEVILCSLNEKELPVYYFTNLLYKVNAYNYYDYIGHRRIFKLRDEFMNPNGLNPELEEKIKFNHIMKKNGMNTPEILAFNKNENFSRDSVNNKIYDFQKFNDYIKHLVDNSTNKSIFIKPLGGIGGEGTFKLDYKNLDKSEYVEKIFLEVRKGKYIYQETIKQHPVIDAIYSQSVNTIRVHTYYDKKCDQVMLTSALIRIGASGSIVDNGNLFVPIDVTSWKLQNMSYSFLKNGAKRYKRHPETNIEFRKVTIPYGDKIEDEVVKAARLFENVFVGWDVAITPTDIKIIEGNGNPHLIMAQIAANGFRNHVVYNKIFGGYL